MPIEFNAVKRGTIHFFNRTYDPAKNSKRKRRLVDVTGGMFTLMDNIVIWASERLLFDLIGKQKKSKALILLSQNLPGFSIYKVFNYDEKLHAIINLHRRNIALKSHDKRYLRTARFPIKDLNKSIKCRTCGAEMYQYYYATGEPFCREHLKEEERIRMKQFREGKL